MDHWEACIEEFQKSQSLDSINSVLHTAVGILKEDLAPFELDWFIQTLLSEPVSLLCIISARLSDDAWTKILKDAYKLLSDLAEKHYEAIEQYIDAIVVECQKPQEARTRSCALQCLASCIKRSLSGANASQYIAELANASTCKGPLALLVGTICEYHPEVVTDQYITIWRIYLNLLGSSKNTDLVCNSLLKGIWCLFKNFGSDIPLREISEFYDKLTRELLNKCESAVLNILRDYAPLFKERLAEDPALRRELWTCSDVSALVAVYREIDTVLGTELVQKILQTEVIPKTINTYTNIKFSALRICSMYALRGARVTDVPLVNACALEFELRSEVTHDTAEAIHWCIEWNAAKSEKLLQTSLLFYDNIPASKRKAIVVDGLLNAPTDVFNTTLNFLTTQSCHDETSLLSFLPIWRDIFESQLEEKRNLLFEKYLDNFLVVVDNFLEDGDDEKKLPEKLSTLLSLTSHISSLQSSEDTSYHCAIIPSKLVALTRACGLQAPIVAVARALIPHVQGDNKLYKIFQMVEIDKCKDETLLCEACLALIQEQEMVKPDVVLMALEVIFTRKDAEPKTLSQGIRKLEQLIVKENNNLDKFAVSKIINLIEQLKSRKDLSGKDARVLQRDVTVFLGKYWNSEDYDAAVNSEDNSLIVRLKDVLTLNVPNPIEGTTYKIKLGRLLHLAIINEDEDALRMLINIICANLCSNTSPLLQQALGRAIVSLCRATVGAARQKVARDAAAFCNVDATMHILKEVTTEKSPAVRRMLSDIIECILMKDQGTESNEALLKAVYKEACAMSESDNSILKLGGLSITDSLLTALKTNRHLSREMLPNLLILISKTLEQDSNEVFDHASALYIENIALFSGTEMDTIAELLKNTLESPFEITNDVKAKIFKNTIKSTLNFCKSLKLDEHSMIEKVLIQKHSTKFVYLWSELPKSFDIKDSLMDDVLCAGDSYVLDSVFNVIDFRDGFALEAHLRFLNQFASVLLMSYSTQTLKHICNIIEHLPPKYVKIHRKLLSKLMTHVKQILHSIPDMILKSFESWSECVPIKDITEHLEKEKFIFEHAMYINSLRILVDIFKLKDPTVVLTTVSIFAKTWSKTILKIYASGHVKYLKKEVPYMTDLMSLSLQFLPVSDVRNLILEGHGLPGLNEDVGLEFCRFFISVFAKYLLRKPFILLENGMEHCWVVLNDIVKCGVRNRWHDDEVENVLELLEQLWPSYISKAPFTSQHSLLLDLSCINRSLYSGCVAMRHAVAIVSGATSCDERIAIIPLLPGGEACSEAYRRFASNLLPTRLSDMDATSSAALRALLDALAGTADTTLLDIVVTLALGDDTPGWWDDATTSCMSSLSTSPTFSTTMLSTLESRARESPSVCRRILLPLLRYAPTSICENFFASTLKELLQSLGGSIKAPSIHPEYAACVQQRTIVLDILQLLFEKVPASIIESPSSSLYEQVPTDKPWHVAREVIRHCYKLRDKIIIPEGATPALTNICREFQYAAYKCMCVCLCVRRPVAHMYNTVLEPQVWGKLVDECAVYELPLRTEWNQRKIVKSVSIRSERRRSLSSSRSRVFLRTLSENPLEFDLVDYDQETVETQDILLPATSLSGHPVSGTLSALLAHLSAVSGRKLHALCLSLQTAKRNAAWLLAQAVCNNKEELKQQATELRPALLAALVNTKEAGLNSLHIDILNTLILWKDDINLPDSGVSHLNTSINCLVETALNNTHRSGIFRMLEDVLDNMLKVYGSYVVGDFNIDASFDDPNKTKSCLKLLLRFSKNNVRVPNLLAMLLTKLETNHRIYRTEMTILAEVIGIEISNSNEQEKRKAAEKLNTILKEIKKNNISDYVKILHHSGCCDQYHFRTIVDTTQKLPEADRKRCLRIISTYISRHPDSDEAGDVPPDIRHMADRMSGDTCFEELFKSTQHTQPPAKKPRLEVRSPILNTVGRKERNLNEALNMLGKDRVKKSSEKMSQDNLGTRFVESFYLAIYLPLKYNTDKPDLSVCLYSFYEMLFHHLKSLDMFRSKRLRDEPWIVEHPIGLSTTRTNRMVGTLRTFSYKSSYLPVEDGETGVDVQVPIEKILDTFIQFAKVTPEAGMELLSQLLRCLGREFDSRPVLAQLLSGLVEVAPQIVAVARECVDQLYSIDGFLQTLEVLKKATVGSEGEHIFKLLHEETVLRCRGPEQFVLGYSPKEAEFMEYEKQFNIEELESSFQKLSNWDELTIQDKRRVEVNLPMLWTERTEFKTLLDDYRDTSGYTSGWFDKMVSLYKDDRRDLMKWLRGLERWPRRPFVISTLTEAMQWHTLDHQEFDIEKLRLSTVIQKNDCLAEWAARLMLRNVYLTDKSDTEATKKLSRSHELRYCERANEMGLHNLALSVIERNYLELEEDETLQWLEQKLAACAARGLKLNDSSDIEKAVNVSKFIPDFYKFSTPDVILSVNVMKMKLEFELKSLSSTKIEETMQLVETQVNRLNERGITSHKNKENLKKLYETAVLYYDGLWNTNVQNNEEILLKLCSYLGRFTSTKLDGVGVAAIILNRLDDCEAISDAVATTILAKLKPIIGHLPDCYFDQLRAKRSLFPADIIRSCGIQFQEEPNLDKYKQCLQLLCDADYLLLQYCEELLRCLTQDPSKWDAIFSRMQKRIFENQYAGFDYQALASYKAPLNGIKTADPSVKSIFLKGVMSELYKKQPRAVLRTEHVCLWDSTAPGTALDRVLRLPRGEHVVKILDELHVFTDSVRRPCVVTALTSIGRKRRYLLKNEDLRADSAAQCLSQTHLSYQVIPLSEDCGLIEFLEDHRRLRDLIASNCDIEIDIERQAAKDEELILAPKTSSVQNFNELCSKIPAYSLRSAIEDLSASVEDFINKKQRFLETLSEVTISNWLFGLGDRHLQNLLYSVQDGGVVCIDWGAIFQYGGAELPPARLTRNMLAVCDTKVLESKLQSSLSSLRESNQFLLPILKLSFKWMENFEDKLAYIQGILQGKMVAHEITKNVLHKSDKAHASKYIEMLDNVFSAHENKEHYSVEEQISNLLLHCTDPWILSVTRTGWEPWL